MGNLYSKVHGFEFKTMMFCFVGPYLAPFGSHAIGNFILDAIKNALEIKGDGTPLDPTCMQMISALAFEDFDRR